MSNQIFLTWSEFVQQFRPVPNKFFEDPGELMYETYGEEFDYVSGYEPNKVWTYIDHDTGSLVVEGLQKTNRVGYFITEIPWEDETSYEIEIE